MKKGKKCHFLPFFYPGKRGKKGEKGGKRAKTPFSPLETAFSLGKGRFGPSRAKTAVFDLGGYLNNTSRVDFFDPPKTPLGGGLKKEKGTGNIFFGRQMGFYVVALLENAIF